MIDYEGTKSDEKYVYQTVNRDSNNYHVLKFIQRRTGGGGAFCVVAHDGKLSVRGEAALIYYNPSVT